LANREPIQIVEIDMDFCTLTYGTGACTAVLGTSGDRKCYNTFQTCQATSAFSKGTLTLRFISPTASIPKNGNVYFPALSSVSTFSNSVNIAGSIPEYGLLGKRGKVTVDLVDFPYHDRYVDKYQAERITGDAQVDEGGYDPETRGTFFTKFKARFPNYAGRALRVIDGYVDGGILTTTQTRNFIITEMSGPGGRNKVRFTAKDILTLAEKKSAVAPKPSGGECLADVAVDATEFTLTPEGIGDQDYPTSGFGVLKSEVISFTRSGDVVTIVNRALFNTETKEVKAGTAFQLAIRYENSRVDDLIEDLLTNYTDIDPTFFPTADWATEVGTWANTLSLSTVITEPTPVAGLLGELSSLGVSLWWDDVAQEIKLKLNSPPDLISIQTLTDDNNIKSIEQEDKDDDRLTQIHFYLQQDNPTEPVTDKSNYDQIRVIIDTESESENLYNGARIREVFCRWLNDSSSQSYAATSSRRLLNRLVLAPKRYRIVLDAKDISLGLGDVFKIKSRVVTDETGKEIETVLQVVQKSETKSGHEFEVIAQAFPFTSIYGFIMENTAPDYGSATETDKSTGCYIVDETTLTFPDGQKAYRMI